MLKKRGYEVILPREGDQTVFVGERTTKAHQGKADLFISIHANAGAQSCSGIETFYCDPSYLTTEIHHGHKHKKGATAHVATKRGSLSKELANALQDQMMKAVGTQTISRGVKGGALQVLMGFQGPAVLIEVGYLTNPIERKLLESKAYRLLLVQGICKGVEKFVEKRFA